MQQEQVLTGGIIQNMGLPMQAGDALFIPEGWWHQVQSEGVTIAVNFWWASDFEQQLGSHMDAYYLRRLIHSMLTTHTAKSLASLCGETLAAPLLGECTQQLTPFSSPTCGFQSALEGFDNQS